MKKGLEYVLCALDSLERTAHRGSPLHRIDARAKLVVTVVFLLTMLSVPPGRLSELMLYFLFPILTAAMGGMRYPQIFRRSLAVVPFVALIGVFNLFYDRRAVFALGPVIVTGGWISLLSIILRGMLSVQALLILIGSTGFYRLCRSMQRLGVPAVFTTQLLFVYRYVCVLLQEALDMSRARDARSFGRRSYPLRIWGTLVGQLLIRTFDRAERIGCAMLARGFTGRIPAVYGSRQRWERRDTLFLVLWSAALVAARLFHPVETIHLVLNR